MENATKALIMAASVLMGVLILSLAVYLFAHFGSEASQLYDRLEEHKLTEYNAQYTVFSGRNDITIYDIITLANKAHQNNEDNQDYADFENSYKVTVSLTGVGNYPNLQDAITTKQQELIKKCSEVTVDGKIVYTFKCLDIQYHPNGKVSSISFTTTT